jgi:tripartite-type tricarboxylate transporter receptor subunit TctC
MRLRRFRNEINQQSLALPKPATTVFREETMFIQKTFRIACASLYGILVLSGATAAANAQSQTYPVKQITLVVGFAAGGFADTFARLVGQELTKKLNIVTVIDNRAGAGGGIAAELVASAPPDGATILVTTTALAINETLYSQRRSALARLVPVAVPVSSPEALAVHPSRQPDLKSFLSAMTGKDITFATAGTGSSSHIAAEYFLKVLAAAKPVHVPFRGGAPSVSAALGNHVDLVAASFGIAPQVAEHKLRGLAVASSSRLDTMPDVPTFSELGFNFEAESWVGIFVPKDTPAALIEMLNGEIDGVVANENTWKALGSQGYIRHRRNISQTSTYVSAEVDKWRTMIKETGVKAE